MANQNQLTIIGGGAGTADYILPAARKAIQQADCVIASERFLKELQISNGEKLDKLSAFLDELPNRIQSGNIAVIVSGDPLLYSLCGTIQKKYPTIKLHVIAGISSLQLLGSAFGLPMEHAAVLSLHGRDCTSGTIACTVAQHPVTCFFCSGTQSISSIVQALLCYQLSDTELYIGANLGYPEQELLHGKPESFLHYTAPALCVAAVRNANAHSVSRPALLPDSAFLRNESPMTKAETRAIILQKLNLQPDSIVWDLGAGTGSISIECARFCPFGKVYAVEYKHTASEILHRNRSYFQLDNLEILSGRAAAQIQHLPVPDCIFIGGSDGEMKQIIQQILQIPKNIRIVIAAVTLETQAEIYPLVRHLPALDIMQISVSHAKAIQNYHILQEQHPVMLYTCMTKE